MSSLTRRGRGLAATGLVGLGAGWGLGQIAIMTISVLLLALPLLGVASVRWSRYVLGSSRWVQPSRFAVGEEAEVVLTIENGSRFTSGVLLLEDGVSPTLGSPNRVLLDRVPPQAHRSERYRITGLQRGRAVVGPLSVTVVDPFGTASMTRAFTSTNSVLVTPRIESLGGSGATRSPGGRGETVFRSLASRGDDDVLPREHRAGDDMRRIHWRATARQGELMVRREEQAWHSSAVIVLDDRENAHHGSGVTSTFEWAVSAAASIAMYYLRNGWQVTVCTSTGRTLAHVPGPTGDDTEALLVAFADVQLSTDPLAPAFGAVIDDAATVVAVLGLIGDDALRTIGRAPGESCACLALEGSPIDRLRVDGWRAAPWSRTTRVVDAWTQVARPWAAVH